MIEWRIHHRPETVSTNLDARAGAHGDVFTADFQTVGRGRLDHKWLSPPRTNLMMSAVLSVAGLTPEHIATFPLVAGLAVCQAICSLGAMKSKDFDGLSPQIKWPNDVLIGGKKVSGILCERQDERVVVGIGINVKRQRFCDEIADRAVSLGLESIVDVRDATLRELGELYSIWLGKGFSAVYDRISELDVLKGQMVSIHQTDADSSPLVGVSNGIMPDGSLDVGGMKVYAGEAHVD